MCYNLYCLLYYCLDSLKKYFGICYSIISFAAGTTHDTNNDAVYKLFCLSLHKFININIAWKWVGPVYEELNNKNLLFLITLFQWI